MKRVCNKVNKKFLGIFAILVNNPPKMLLYSEVLEMHLFDTKVSFLWIYRCQCKTYIFFEFLERFVTKGLKYRTLAPFIGQVWKYRIL